MTDPERGDFEKYLLAFSRQSLHLDGERPIDRDHAEDAAQRATAKRIMAITLSDISIRTRLAPGDLGYLIHLHGKLYGAEYQYGIQFETYVANGLREFYRNYDPARDRIWLCEHSDQIVGSLLLMHRKENIAQLRYFLIRPEYRGIGLGKRLMDLFMDFLHQGGYLSAYLWTTSELHAAASLYRRYGFTLMEEKPSTAFGKPVVEQRYDLTVSPALSYSHG